MSSNEEAERNAGESEEPPAKKLKTAKDWIPIRDYHVVVGDTHSREDRTTVATRLLREIKMEFKKENKGLKRGDWVPAAIQRFRQRAREKFAKDIADDWVLIRCTAPRAKEIKQANTHGYVIDGKPLFGVAVDPDDALAKFLNSRDAPTMAGVLKRYRTDLETLQHERLRPPDEMLQRMSKRLDFFETLHEEATQGDEIAKLMLDKLSPINTFKCVWKELLKYKKPHSKPYCDQKAPASVTDEDAKSGRGCSSPESMQQMCETALETARRSTVTQLSREVSVYDAERMNDQLYHPTMVNPNTDPEEDPRGAKRSCNFLDADFSSPTLVSNFDDMPSLQAKQFGCNEESKALSLDPRALEPSIRPLQQPMTLPHQHSNVSVPRAREPSVPPLHQQIVAAAAPPVLYRQDSDDESQFNIFDLLGLFVSSETASTQCDTNQKDFRVKRHDNINSEDSKLPASRNSGSLTRSTALYKEPVGNIGGLLATEARPMAVTIDGPSPSLGSPNAFRDEGQNSSAHGLHDESVRSPAPESRPGAFFIAGPGPSHPLDVHQDSDNQRQTSGTTEDVGEHDLEWEMRSESTFDPDLDSVDRFALDETDDVTGPPEFNAMIVTTPKPIEQNISMEAIPIAYAVDESSVVIVKADLVTSMDEIRKRCVWTQILWPWGPFLAQFRRRQRPFRKLFSRSKRCTSEYMSNDEIVLDHRLKPEPIDHRHEAFQQTASSTEVAPCNLLSRLFWPTLHARSIKEYDETDLDETGHKICKMEAREKNNRAVSKETSWDIQTSSIASAPTIPAVQREADIEHCRVIVLQAVLAEPELVEACVYMPDSRSRNPGLSILRLIGQFRGRLRRSRAAKKEKKPSA